MFKSREQNAGQGKNINIENSSFKRVEDFRKGLDIPKLSSEKIKSRLISGNVW